MISTVVTGGLKYRGLAPITLRGIKDPPAPSAGEPAGDVRKAGPKSKK